MPWRLIAVSVAAFALGSIPFGYLVYRLRTGRDIRRQGSGNIGATNVLRAAGKAPGLLTLALDAAKGYAALWLAARVAGVPALPAALLLVVAGHLYTPWLGFRGGKGVAAGLGAFLYLAPAALAAALALWLAVAAIWRFVSLASIAACIALPALLLYFAPASGSPLLLAASAVCLLVIVRHRANLARLRAGTEPKLFARRAA